MWLEAQKHLGPDGMLFYVLEGHLYINKEDENC